MRQLLTKSKNKLQNNIVKQHFFTTLKPNTLYQNKYQKQYKDKLHTNSHQKNCLNSTKTLQNLLNTYNFCSNNNKPNKNYHPDYAELDPHKGHSQYSNNNQPSQNYQQTTQQFEKDIYSFLNYNGFEYRKRASGGGIQVRECPFCHDIKNDYTNMHTLNISTENGLYHCFRCNASGNWIQFKSIVQGYENACDVHHQNQPEEQDIFQAQDYYPAYENLLSNDKQYDKFKDYLTSKEDNVSRHIDYEVLKLYKIGLGFEQFYDSEGTKQNIPVIYFPMYQPKQQKNSKKNKKEKKDKLSIDDKMDNEINTEHYKLVRCKVRGMGPENKRYMRQVPTGQIWGLFGLNTVPDNAKEIIITEGEFDAMAAYQATGIPAVSLPSGASSLPTKVLGYFERFQKIYLWMDGDLVGQNLSPKIAEKLGTRKTHIVSTEDNGQKGPKDANDALRIFKNDPEVLKDYIRRAKTQEQQNILQFDDLYQQITLRILNHNQSTGAKARSLKFYNKYMKGLRFGEFSIFTGPTGSGKTTLLSQLSIELASRGVRTLWGSFEIKNDILGKNMMLQHSNQNLIDEPGKLPYYAEKFQHLPLYFLSFYGQQELTKVFKSIDYAIDEYNVQHVIIDNLQFLVGTQIQGVQQFSFQDRVVQQLRQLATEKNIHISLVIHPKKANEDEDLTMAHIFGTAKSTQEADNVFIVQRRDKYRVIDIKKNRFDGDVGRQAVVFDKNTKRFIEANHSDIKLMLEGQYSPKEVFERAKNHDTYDVDFFDNDDGNDDGGNNNGNDGGSSGGGAQGGGGNNNQGGSTINSLESRKQQMINEYYQRQKEIKTQKDNLIENKFNIDVQDQNVKKTLQNNQITPKREVTHKQQQQLQEDFQNMQNEQYENMEALKQRCHDQGEIEEIEDMQAQEFLKQKPYIPDNHDDIYNEQIDDIYDQYEPIAQDIYEQNNKSQVQNNNNDGGDGNNGSNRKQNLNNNNNNTKLNNKDNNIINNQNQEKQTNNEFQNINNEYHSITENDKQQQQQQQKQKYIQQQQQQQTDSDYDLSSSDFSDSEMIQTFDGIYNMVNDNNINIKQEFFTGSGYNRIETEDNSQKYTSKSYKKSNSNNSGFNYSNFHYQYAKHKSNNNNENI